MMILCGRDDFMWKRYRFGVMVFRWYEVYYGWRYVLGEVSLESILYVYAFVIFGRSWIDRRFGFKRYGGWFIVLVLKVIWWSFWGKRRYVVEGFEFKWTRWIDCWLYIEICLGFRWGFVRVSLICRWVSESGDNIL